MRSRKIKHTFFTQMSTLLDWHPVITVLKTHYTKGKSITGKPSYSGLLLLKMSVSQTWYGLPAVNSTNQNIKLKEGILKLAANDSFKSNYKIKI